MRRVEVDGAPQERCRFVNAVELEKHGTADAVGLRMVGSQRERRAVMSEGFLPATAVPRRMPERPRVLPLRLVHAPTDARRGAAALN